MQIKWLSFAFIYFSESGLFNGLRPIQIRKIDSRLRLCSECLKPVPLSRPHAVCLGAGSLPANGKIYSTDFRFPQTIALFFCPLRSYRPDAPCSSEPTSKWRAPSGHGKSWSAPVALQRKDVAKHGQNRTRGTPASPSRPKDRPPRAPSMALRNLLRNCRQTRGPSRCGAAAQGAVGRRRGRPSPACVRL
jgi:hypothetical protein